MSDAGATGATFVEVVIHQSFSNGVNDKPFFVDLRNLSHDELLALIDFASAILEGKSIRGRNKRSGYNPDGTPARNSDRYRNSGAMHIHCGPSWSADNNPGNPKTPADLRANEGGDTSKEVIHHVARVTAAGKKLLIFGFSRNHLPFQGSDLVSSPHRYRLATPDRTAPLPGLPTTTGGPDNT